MFRDGNIPEGQYGHHYNKITGAHTRRVTAPVSDTTNWERNAISAVLLLEEIKYKHNI